MLRLSIKYHKILLKKCKAYGINGSLLKWVEAFLKNRRQRVVMGEYVSTWLEIWSCVPQGSCLGLLLFLIYINDIPGIVRSNCKLYADDSKLIKSIKYAEDLQNDLDLLVEWTNKWLMKLNKEKCKVMHIGHKNPQNNYNITENGEVYTLLKTTVERDLGVLISSDMKWHDQAHAAAAKAQMALV